MPRIRTIKPELPQSESMGRVSRDARLCFIQLFTLSDDFGKLRGNSRMLASLLYPYDDDAPNLIVSWLAELEAEDCIRQYSVDGTHYVLINNWQSHQKVDKPTPSKIPDPPDEPREDSRGLPETSRSVVVGSGPKDQGKDQRTKEGTDVPRTHVDPDPPAREPAPPPRKPPERVGNITLPAYLAEKPPTYAAVEFHPRFNEVREHITHRLPNLGRQNATEVNRWLQSGADPELDIFPTVEHLIGLKGGDIGSFRFFTRAVESSIAARKEAEEQHERLSRKFAEQDAAAERTPHAQAE
jgi:hypothetical protein